MQNNGPGEEKITVELDNQYNPYKDKTLTEAQPEPPTLEYGNEPFNDAIRYENLVSGRQRNRTISDYPRRQRPWVKVSAVSCLVLVVLSLLWDFLH